MYWNDDAFDSGVIANHHGDVCEVACMEEEVWMSRGGTPPSWCGALLVHGDACYRVFPDHRGIAATAKLVCDDSVCEVVCADSMSSSLCGS